VVKHYDLPVTLRVAGGWVRDKLLGKSSADIDIALDCMLGREFAKKVNQYLQSRGEETHGRARARLVQSHHVFQTHVS